LELVRGVHIQEVLDGLFVLHLIVHIAAARGDGSHAGGGDLSPDVSSGVVPVEARGGRRWGRGVAGLGETVAAGDAVDAGLALGGIVDHFGELGLRIWVGVSGRLS
jgi:hypothetical protein